ncbi:hypothetical protein IAU60_006912 [Kwoniella sp. DSM 27419]
MTTNSSRRRKSGLHPPPSLASHNDHDRIVEQLQDDIQHLQTTKVMQADALAEKNVELDDLRKTFQDVEVEMETLKSVETNLRSQLAKAKKDLETLRAYKDKQEAQAKVEIAELQRMNADAERSVANAEVKLAEHDEIVSEMKAKEATLKKDWHKREDLLKTKLLRRTDYFLGAIWEMPLEVPGGDGSHISPVELTSMILEWSEGSLEKFMGKVDISKQAALGVKSRPDSVGTVIFHLSLLRHLGQSSIVTAQEKADIDDSCTMILDASHPALVKVVSDWIEQFPEAPNPHDVLIKHLDRIWEVSTTYGFPDEDRDVFSRKHYSEILAVMQVAYRSDWITQVFHPAVREWNSSHGFDLAL